MDSVEAINNYNLFFIIRINLDEDCNQKLLWNE